jgi:hypothetical protein
VEEELNSYQSIVHVINLKLGLRQRYFQESNSDVQTCIRLHYDSKGPFFFVGLT